MKVDRYKKYKRYNLIAIPLIIFIYLLSEEKNDLYYTFSVIVGILIMIFGSWLSIQINRELKIPITQMHTINFWVSILIGIPLLLSVLIKVKL